MKIYFILFISLVSSNVYSCQLSRAVREGKEDIIATLLAAGVSDDCKRQALDEVFYHASFPRHARMIALFLDSGTSVDCKDSRGRTLLRRAAEEADTDAVELLLQRHASVLEVDLQGEPLYQYVNNPGINHKIRARIQAEFQKLNQELPTTK